MAVLVSVLFGGDAVAALAGAALEGLNGYPLFLANCSAQKAADRMRLPSWGLHKFLQGNATCPLQQTPDLGRFAAGAGRGSLLRAGGLAGPNLNAFAERWVRSVKEECLSKVILFGPGPLSRVLAEYGRHYHHERNHQGKDNRLLFPDVSGNSSPRSRSIECRHRLGGLLKYYRRAA